MNKVRIDSLLKDGKLRVCQPDKSLASSLITSAKSDADFVLSLPITKESATVVFRTLYESIRQLGEARWVLQGYKPDGHDVSLESLTDLDVRAKVKLNNIDRFRRIRNDANYRGFTVSVEQATEVVAFWKDCGREIATIISKEL